MYYCPRCIAHQSIDVLVTYQIKPKDGLCYYCDKPVIIVTNEELVKTATDTMVPLIYKERS